MAIDWLLVFLFGLSIDIFYSLYIVAVAKGREWHAAVCSVMIYIPGLIGLFGILDNPWLSLPYGLGLFFGTVVGIRMGRWLTREEDDTNT